MRKRLIIAIVASAILLSIPLAISTLTYQETIHMQGTGTFPNTSGQPTPTPTPCETVKFSLWYCNAAGVKNGTQLPSTIQNIRLPIILKGPIPVQPTLYFLVQNDGNVAISGNAAIQNQNFPSAITTEMYFQSTDQFALQPGETKMIVFTGVMHPTGAYTPNEAFSYSFDLVVTATKA